ncbi:Iah1, partial [Symbiodinium microadriaticum]
LPLRKHWMRQRLSSTQIYKFLEPLTRSGRLNMSAAGESGDGVASARNAGISIVTRSSRLTG